MDEKKEVPWRLNKIEKEPRMQKLDVSVTWILKSSKWRQGKYEEKACNFKKWIIQLMRMTKR